MVLYFFTQGCFRDFSRIAKPLHALIQGAHSKKKSHKNRSSQFYWGTHEQQTIDKIVECLTSAPVLAFTDFQLPFELYTDTPGDGLGTVLYQRQNELKRLVAYSSRSLLRSEPNY